MSFVGFNYRWAPGPTLVKKLLSEGTIGDILHVDMEYLLNTHHGAHYFRRWHRDKKNSGGLMVHKSTHHFDLVNWWIDAVPDTVFGFGRLAYYGKENAAKRGVQSDFTHYTGNADPDTDPFAFTLNAPDARRMYLDAARHDGYRPDQNVFADGITSEDSMSVLVKYRTGAVLNYSLNAYLPREGFHVVFNGTGGRLEFTESHHAHYFNEAGKPVDGPEHTVPDRIVVHPLFGRPYDVAVPHATGGHGGGDPKLINQIFARQPETDRWQRSARHGQGAASILIGVGANQSFDTGQPVRVGELCPKLGDVARLHDLP